MSDQFIAGGVTHNRRGFGSDNQSGIHPSILNAIIEANVGHVDAYGDDAWTKTAEELIAAEFGAPCTVAVTFNGTGTNVCGLAAALDPWSAVICADTAHINTDECGAPHHVLGVQLYTCPTPDGKLTPEMVKTYFHNFGSEHHREPKVISITNLSEMGTVYTAEEIRALADLAHEHGMFLHVDGARLGNAAESLGCTIAEITGRAGVDILSFGGTKDGFLAAEALVLGERIDAEKIRYIRKQNLQLFSKQRFASAQFIGALESGAYYQCARNANDRAKQLYEGARAAGVEFLYAVDGNELFAILPKEHVESLQDRFRFYTWKEDEKPGFDSVRWVTSWDTTPEDVDELIEALKGLGLNGS